jgi:uncharacterized FAD-dependent dehydrogenase
MGQLFPGFLTQILREGFFKFGKSMKGYLTNEAILHAQNQEPLRLFVFRDSVTYEHLQIKGLYPCGEGQAMLEELYLPPLMEKNVL